MERKKIIGIIKRYVQMVIGVIILAISYNVFILPNNFVYGGVGGIAIIIKKLFGLDPATFIFIASIVLLLISFVTLGKTKTLGSVVGSILYPIMVKLTSSLCVYINFQNQQPLLFALFGGILSGIGLGLVYKAGFSTGGTDITAQIINKYCKVSMGKSVILCDGIVLIFGTFIFGITNFLYAIIVLYLISLIVDKVLLGISDSKAFYIITEKDEQVKEYIINKLGHGVTIFKAKGAYKKKNKNVLFCVIPTREYFKLKEGIAEIDIDAFFVVTDAYEVYGGE